LTSDYTSSGVRVAQSELQSLLESMFQSAGMSDGDATLVSDSLIVADLGGTHSHGVLRVPEYVKKMTVDGVNPVGRPSLVSDRCSAMVVDGDNAMGQIACSFAMQQVIERARDTGIAAAAIRGSNHCGACSYYAEMAIAEDMIGIATTNALPTMAPEGGADPILGIDPMAVSIAAGDEHPISYDAAFSGTAHGKIRVYEQKGLQLPEGWVLDSDGVPITDPTAAISGLLLPIGGFKGASMAMIMGILSSMLSGAAYGTELGTMIDGPTSGKDGQFVMALNVASFVDVDEFKARVDASIRQVHESRKAPGPDRIWVAGEREFETRAINIEQGIPLNDVTIRDIRLSADEQGVDISPYGWLTE